MRRRRSLTRGSQPLRSRHHFNHHPGFHPMSEPELNQQEASELEALSSQPVGARLKYYAKRTGPGWLQAAITLGGGSLAGALFLGVMMGYNLMWLQPLAMIFGVVMLSAIAYVTL